MKVFRSSTGPTLMRGNSASSSSLSFGQQLLGREDLLIGQFIEPAIGLIMCRPRLVPGLGPTDTDSGGDRFRVIDHFTAQKRCRTAGLVSQHLRTLRDFN